MGGRGDLTQPGHSSAKEDGEDIVIFVAVVHKGRKLPQRMHCPDQYEEGNLRDTVRICHGIMQ